MVLISYLDGCIARKSNKNLKYWCAQVFFLFLSFPFISYYSGSERETTTTYFRKKECDTEPWLMTQQKL